jgi:hypothetical protein
VPSSPAGAAPTPTNILKTALLELTQRHRYIDEELARLVGLQAEKELIRKQIDAVSVALQAFGEGTR